MKKLILLLLTPIVFLGQDVKTNEYFNDGKKIIEKTWQEDGQSKTLVEIVSGGSSEFRYYINQNDVEVGLNMYRVRDYGKYFKVDVSIINNSQKRYDFNPSKIYVKVKGDVKNKEKYYALPYNQYNEKVVRRQNSNAFLLSLAKGVGNSGISFSKSNSSFGSTNSSGYISTNTTTFSPALASIQMSQSAEEMSKFKNNQKERMKFINEGYLKNHTLFPKTQLEGYFLIPFHKKITQVDLVIYLGDMTFDYSNEKWGL